MCHSLNPGINSGIHADPVASLSVMAVRQEQSKVEERLKCTALFVLLALLVLYSLCDYTRSPY